MNLPNCINLPNFITSIRLLLSPFIIILLINNYFKIATLFFFIASISDAADGIVARAMNKETVFGAYLDPIADKVLLTSIYFTLSYIECIPLWLSFIVIFRDFFILSGILLLLLFSYNMKLSPFIISKFNTFIQIVCISWVLFYLSFPSFFVWKLDLIIIICVACSTFMSGVVYLICFYRHLDIDFSIYYRYKYK